jgi:peptide/nickel transport system substrate-binding protein
MIGAFRWFPAPAAPSLAEMPSGVNRMITPCDRDTEHFLSQDWLDRRRFLLGSAAAGGAGLLSALAQPAFASARKGGILRYGVGDSFAGEILDPARAVNGQSLELMPVIYETLVRRGTNWSHHPWLAESYELDKTKPIWTIRVRKGVKFHDGSPLTATDVAYTLARIVDEDTGSSITNRLKQSYDPKGLEVVDEHTLRIHMKRPDTLLMQPLSRYQVGIIKAGTSPNADVASAVGTGPFRLTGFEPGQSWQVERFAGYWQPDVPQLDGIQCVYVAEQIAKVQALLSGALDVIDPVKAVVAKELSTNPKVRPAPLRFGLCYGIFISEAVKPFDDVRVRRAVKLAVDRKLILDTVFQGVGAITADIPIPPGDPSFPTDLDPSQDLAGAKKLLLEAGHPDGIEFELFTSPIWPGFVDLAVAFAESVKPAGIRVKVTQWPAATYWDQVWVKYPTYVDYMTHRNAHDILDAAYCKGSAYNGIHFDEDGKLREFIGEALAERDPERQAEMYTIALKRVALESGLIIPCFIDRTFMVSKSVEGNPFEWEMPPSLFALSKSA